MGCAACLCCIEDATFAKRSHLSVYLEHRKCYWPLKAASPKFDPTTPAKEPSVSSTAVVDPCVSSMNV